MEELIKILRQFDKNRKQMIGTNWNAAAVADCFRPCAEDILCKGYFLINEKYIIDIGAIELYYHEEREDGKIKDYIMYHTNAHPYKAKMCEIAGGYPYFKFGSFNLQQSGLDITFEKEKEYRASFLIRSYRLLKTENGEYPQENNTKYDHCSTHIFDDMFYEGISFNNTKIEWIKIHNKGRDMDESIFRINVPMYRKKGKEKYEKLTVEYMDNHDLLLSVDRGLAESESERKIEKHEVKTFRTNGKDFVRDTRPWRFCLKGIYEKSKEHGK